MTTDTTHSKGLLPWIWRRYLKRHTSLMLVALVFMAIEGSMFGLLSYIMKPMFDRVFIGGEADAIGWIGGAIFAIFAVRAVAGILQKWVLARISQETVAEIRTDLLGHLMILDMGFHQTHPPGHLMQRVEGDVGSVKNLWQTILTGAGRDLIALVSLMIVAIAIDPIWTLIALVGVPVLVMPTIMAQRAVRKNARIARDVAARLSVRLSEVFQGIVPVKLNTLERYQARRYGELTRSRIETEVRSSVAQAVIPGLIDIMSGIGFFLVLLYGGREILDGQKTVGDFMAFFTAIGLAFEPLRRLGNISGVWQVAAAAMERIRELLETEPALKDPTDPFPPPNGVPEIRLDNVDVTYGESAVLNGISIVAEAGKTTALVGPSGAGKSTVFGLLTRLIDPQSGSVTIGDVPVSAMRMSDLRALFSVVSQDALLFDDSLRENILLDLDNVTDAGLQNALAAAHVTDFLSRMPDGLDSPAGPRGTNLSGGQRQRIAIARALLRNTPVLLLDEATSALDAQSEKVVQNALDRLAEGRTTLVIAHRLSTVRSADKIVVMDAGKVVEQGTHDALMARGGVYADLYRLQSASQPKEDPNADPRV